VTTLSRTAVTRRGLRSPGRRAGSPIATRSATSGTWSGENIVAFGQGTYEGKQGIVALTDHRLFFYRGSFRESVEEFGLGSIRSLEVGKDTTGERLVIHASGDRAEITQMRPGQADELTRAFRALELRPSDPADARDLIRMLDELRDAGVLTAEEFDAKKAALLDRL
jgi:hypothetical protein